MNALPVASLREAHSVASYVRLGPDRPNLQAAADLPTRTAAQILADRDAAQAERETLEASRASLLLTGSADDVVALDHRIAVTRVRQDQAEAQHAVAVVAEAKAQAEHEAEQKRRKDLLRKALKASVEVEKLADEYVVEAKRLVPLLEKIRDRAALIAAANVALPDGADPVPTGEPRCSWQGWQDQPHTSIASRVKLPNLGTGTGYIWGDVVPLPGRINDDTH